ncbi:WD40/YVTN/BNR-like repeat-containing protein [Streptomyces sp. NPDC090108]|uniref:WD40/YVTN/BNR-like repeat-containing protein n=1 Tax=Streptomyces sp. NPDC090108 TaxID=3365947 RepID=UPI0038013300
MRRLGSTRRGRRTGLLVTAGVVCGAALAALTTPAAQARPATAGQGTERTVAHGSERTAARGSERTAAHGAPGAAAQGAGRTAAHWAEKDTGTPQVRYRGLSAVDRDTAWLAGSGGTVLRTTDGGTNWRDVSPPGAADLEFRDVEAFDARRAVVLAIGEGEASRVYRTDDGGTTWTESFRNADPKAFYDCLAFFDHRHGLAMSDPVDGKFRLLSTVDGGRSWRPLPADRMPAALDGEAGFAASGQCLVTAGPKDVWLATGGGAHARVLHSGDRGLTWTATVTPVPAGDPARGVFALAFRDRAHGIAVGGDYRAGQNSPQAAAVTGDGGRTWRPSATPPPAYRSGAVWLPRSRTTALAVGPTGTDLTRDGGRTWHTFGTGSYDTVDCAPDRGCWAAGEKGRVARLER